MATLLTIKYIKFKIKKPTVHVDTKLTIVDHTKQIFLALAALGLFNINCT